MGLLDKAKDIYKQQHDKAIALKDERGNKVAGLPAEYMGGYGDRGKATGLLTFYERQTEFKVALSEKRSFVIPNANIADLAVEGKDEVNRRVTVTRLLAVGIFAFALKKKNKDKEAFVTLVLTDGQEVIFHINNKSPMELKVALSKVTLQIKQSKQT